MWKTCLLTIPLGLFCCILLVYLTIGNDPYLIVLKIKNATSQSNQFLNVNQTKAQNLDYKVATLLNYGHSPNFNVFFFK